MKKKYLRFVSLLMTVILMVTAVPTSVSAAGTPFTDVDANAWYAKAVTYAYEHQLFNGTGGTNFSPNAPMTRAMFVQVLANKTENYSKGDWVGKSSFSDVKADSWYAAPVEWAAKAGLVNGVGNGEFAPEKNVTRQEMAVILYHYAQKTGNDVSFEDTALDSFSDASTVSSWAREAMTWAATHGVINGFEGKLNPQNNAKRCEVAQVTVNAESVLVKVTVSVETEVEDEPEPEPEPESVIHPTPVTPTPTPDQETDSVTVKIVFSDGIYTQTVTSEDKPAGFGTLHTYLTEDWVGYIEVSARGNGPFKFSGIPFGTESGGSYRWDFNISDNELIHGGAWEFKSGVSDAAGHVFSYEFCVRTFGLEDDYEGLDGSKPDPNHVR